MSELSCNSVCLVSTAELAEFEQNIIRMPESGVPYQLHWLVIVHTV